MHSVSQLNFYIPDTADVLPNVTMVISPENSMLTDLLRYTFVKEFRVEERDLSTENCPNYTE